MAATCPSCSTPLAEGATSCPVCHTAIAGTQSNIIGALSYLLLPITGIVFLYLEPYNKDDYVRFHARQAIALGVAWFALNIVLGVFIAVLPHALGSLFGAIEGLVNLGLAVLWVFLMYQAYSGNRFRIPVLADMADSVGL